MWPPSEETSVESHRAQTLGTFSPRSAGKRSWVRVCNPAAPDFAACRPDPHPHPDPDPHTCLCVETTQGVCGSHTGAGSEVGPRPLPVDIGSRRRRTQLPRPFWPRNGTLRVATGRRARLLAQNFKPEPTLYQSVPGPPISGLGGVWTPPAVAR